MRRLRALLLLAAGAAALAGCGGGSQPATSTTPPAGTEPPPAATAPLAPATTTAPAAAPFRARLEVESREPTAGTTWPYRLEVTDPGGAPIHARITVQVVDPLQQPHPVELGRTTTKLTDWPIDGSFADDVIWPANARGFPLTFRVIVEAAGAKATLTVPVRVR